MKDFNDIGISRRLDWPRIQHLFRLGLFGAFLTLIGDLILGWGVEDETLTGILRMLFGLYGHLRRRHSRLGAAGSVSGLRWRGCATSAFTGCSQKMRPDMLTAIGPEFFGYVIFGGCGFHVPVCAAGVSDEATGFPTELLEKYAAYFVTPSTALFWIFFLVLVITQIQVFAKGLTPYPKGCWVFSLPVGMAAAMLPKRLWQSAMGQRADLRMDQHRQPVDVRRAAGGNEKGENHRGRKRTCCIQKNWELFEKEHPCQFVTVDGARFRYILCGREGGKTLVLLNGGMNTLEMWMDYVDDLSQENRVLLFDYPQELRTNQELVVGMHSFFRKLGVREPIFVGASDGGMVSQIYVQKYPGETGGLILISTGGMDENTLKSLKRKYLPCRRHAVVHEALQL